jgi:phosphoenolpyruvate-protein phosphotransferase
MKKVYGLAASEGLALGKAYVLPEEKELVILAYSIAEEEIPAQEKKLDVAIETVRERLAASLEKIDTQKTTKEILRTHLSMLEDTAFIESIKDELRQTKMNIEHTLNKKVSELLGMLSGQDDVYMQARAIDFKDTFDEVLYELLNKPEHSKNRFKNIPRGVILFAKEVKPSEAILMREAGIAGLVTEEGSATSHIAIMARAWGIPMLVGVSSCEFPHFSLCEKEVILDCDESCAICDASDGEIARFAEIIKEKNIIEETFFSVEVQSTPIYTSNDGIPIKLEANIALPDEVSDKKFLYASGIGLFRTEFLILDEGKIPGEDEQFEMYAKVVRSLQGKPVVMRTFDIGADKMISEQELLGEKNPMLGWRGVRYCIDKRSLFKTQLKAILRAAAFGQVKILLPMVSTVNEVLTVREIIAEACTELTVQKAEFSQNVPVGIMVEVPSAAIAAKTFARYVDFMSIGTNDLTQYVMATDRENTKVAPIASYFNPAVLDLLALVLKAEPFIKATDGEPKVSMCGEMASDELAVPLLFAMGLRAFSMQLRKIPKMAAFFSKLTMENAKAILKKTEQATSADEVKKLVVSGLHEFGLV